MLESRRSGPPDTGPSHDAPAPRGDLALLQRRMRRKIIARTRRAHATGMFDGLLTQLGPDDVVVDCGANVGVVSGPLADTGATVYAFEPDPVAFAELQTRLGARDNVHLMPGAVGLTSGTATLHRSVTFTDDPLSGTVGSTLLDGVRPAEAGHGQNITVPVHDLPAILADLARGDLPDTLSLDPPPHCGRLAFVKLDIEGAELSLLRALHDSGLLARIPCLVAETHERKFPALRPDFAALRRDIAAAYPARQVCLDWV
ncbi:FkbM family methyltransferase [Jannaschia pohangensis]|uniref:Methyltransferase, FkbM family n=1 Tax=Jannaschia pohangensis TaxID=390807 RepID=A0A1I3S3H8_9RHOB|nr:FkbM family methyltransferase [Jannaschia pohangensis]SFJ52111.1 methyltransferase, FkbM family [Jannaschia pohangensis]